MKLRSQLLLVSLCILVLPWAGCQYIREMEQVLLESQARELEATARAVSAHLQTQVQELSTTTLPNVDLQQQLYFHRLRYEPILDGEVEDWLLPILKSQSFVSASANQLRVSLFAGTHRDLAYLIFEIIDNVPQFHNIQQSGLANGDHIVLRSLDDNKAIVEYVLRASAQGPFSARYVNPDGQIRQEHRIRGYWSKKSEGYIVEVLLPLRVIGERLDFAYRKQNNQSVGTLRPALLPPPWVQPSANIEAIIAIYSDQPDMRINVIDPRGWLLAQSGQLNDSNFEDFTTVDWQSSIYRLALGEMALDRLDNPLINGRMDSLEVESALANEPATRLYQNGNRRVARTAVPIRQNNMVVGAVAVEQSTDSLIEGTNTAFNRLFYFMGIAFAVVFIAVFALASILSFRIRRLSKAADNTIGEDGKIKADFIRSRSGDEIGDLTRSYGQLLTRLRDYTDYLRTLASKLSHELRTPLAVVRSSLENLDHAGDNGEAQQYRQRAKEGAERLANILAAMSSASHMEDSIKHTPTENFQLDTLVRELTEAYRSTYPQSQFALNIEPGTYVLHGSPDLIVQMLDKLIDNAVDFCPTYGKILLSLNRHKKTLQLSISNTGPLLPDNMQGQLFDSLVSIRDSKAHQQKTHLGLGLYIVRLIVDFHNGQIHGRNLGDGSGVSFDIELPAAG